MSQNGNKKFENWSTNKNKSGPSPQGGTLKFSVYIGEADFFGVKILNFRIFLGFQKNWLFFRVVSFLWIFFWGHAFSELFFWGHL